MPYLPGHAAAAICAAANLSVVGYGFPREVRCMRAQPPPPACNRARAAVNPLHRPSGDRGSALALRPRYTRPTRPLSPRCRRRQRRRRAAAACRRTLRGRPGSIPGGGYGGPRPPHASGSRRGGRRRVPLGGWRAQSARGGSGWPRSGRGAASRRLSGAWHAPCMPQARDRRYLEPQTARRRLQAGWGRPGGGPRPRWGWWNRQERLWWAAGVARARVATCMRNSKGSRFCEIQISGGRYSGEPGAYYCA